LISLLATNAIYIVLLEVDHPWPWALNIAAILLGAAPLTIALTVRHDFTHLLRWLLVGLYCVLAVFLLAFQNRPGTGLDIASNAVMFTVFFGCCIHVWYSYRQRASAGSLITIVGFLGWAMVYVLAPLVGFLVPKAQIETEVWNLPKYVVVVGMIILLLEDQIEFRYRMQKHHEYLAYHDELTDLPNRRFYLEHLEKSLNRARESGAQVALLVVDLNRFKQINDTIGHDAGDLVLKQAAQRFLRCIRPLDTVARTGGDEFCLVLSSPTNREHAAIVARSIEQALKEPLMLSGEMVQIGASVGVAIFPEDADNLRSLCFFADSSMYETKRGSGKPITS
jgi:diguanylate cyclase (GGDEF)-like protein